MVRRIISLIGLLIGLSLAVTPALADCINTDYYSQTCCAWGRCTVSVYDTINFVPENGVWIPINEAKGDLTKYFRIAYITKDPDLDIQLVNLTNDYVKFRVLVSDKFADKTVPFSYYYEKTSKGGVKEKFDEFTYKDKFDKNGGFVDITGYPFGKTYKLGSNSTTVQLIAPNTENLDDTQVRSGAPNTNYGGLADQCYSQGYTDNYRCYLKYNLTVIPAGKTILNGTYCGYKTSGGGGNFTIHHVWNQTWNEEGITWNSQPCASGMDNADVVSGCNLTMSDNRIYDGTQDIYRCFDLTSGVKTDYGNGKTNISMVVKAFTEGGALSEMNIYNKESAGNRPYLNITYDEPALSSSTTTTTEETTTTSTTVFPLGNSSACCPDIVPLMAKSCVDAWTVRYRASLNNYTYEVIADCPYGCSVRTGCNADPLLIDFGVFFAVIAVICAIVAIMLWIRRL